MGGRLIISIYGTFMKSTVIIVCVCMCVSNNTNPHCGGGPIDPVCWPEYNNCRVGTLCIKGWPRRSIDVIHYKNFNNSF